MGEVPRKGSPEGAGVIANQGMGGGGTGEEGEKAAVAAAGRRSGVVKSQNRSEQTQLTLQ